MKKLLLCFLVPCFNLFASTVAATDFQISNSTNSCYKDECVITLNILATDTHSISNKPQILNKNVAVLSNECTSSKCSLLLRLPAKEKFVNLFVVRLSSYFYF